MFFSIFHTKNTPKRPDRLKSCCTHFFYPFLEKTVSASVAACDIKTTQEHSIQISVERAQGLSQDTCLETAYHAESAAVFCPDEKLCGWDLQINRTAELKYLSMKSCQVFMKKRIDCALFEHELRQSGESSFLESQVGSVSSLYNVSQHRSSERKLPSVVFFSIISIKILYVFLSILDFRYISLGYLNGFC